MFILKRIVLLSAIVISSNSFSATTNKSMVDNDLHDSPNPDLLMAIDMAMAIRSHHNQLTINPTVRELLKLKIINSSMIQDNKTYTYFNTEFIINKSKISYKNINKKKLSRNN